MIIFVINLFREINSKTKALQHYYMRFECTTIGVIGRDPLSWPSSHSGGYLLRSINAILRSNYVVIVFIMFNYFH